MKSAIWNDPKYADAEFHLIQTFEDGPLCDNCPSRAINYFSTAEGLALALCSSCTEQAGKQAIVNLDEQPRTSWTKK